MNFRTSPSTGSSFNSGRFNPDSRTPQITFNPETHLKELSERFARLIKKLGPNNRKGTLRYNYEVDFCYALNEISFCPPYLQGKMFENASNVVSSLINLIQLQTKPNKESQEDL